MRNHNLRRRISVQVLRKKIAEIEENSMRDQQRYEYLNRFSRLLRLREANLEELNEQDCAYSTSPYFLLFAIVLKTNKATKQEKFSLTLG